MMIQPVNLQLFCAFYVGQSTMSTVLGDTGLKEIATNPNTKIVYSLVIVKQVINEETWYF